MNVGEFQNIKVVASKTISSMTKKQRKEFLERTTPKWNKYIPHTPTSKQAAFLLLPQKEAFFGGAAGGGKSDALLMGALQYVDVPGYSAIIFRKSFSDLNLPGALIDRAKQWLLQFDEVKWKEKDKKFVFPSGAVLQFGYMDNENDKYKYQGGEYQFIGFDELTQFAERDYKYMFSRLRRLKTSPVPLRVRSASNPGGTGHEWVKNRLVVEGRKNHRIFIPANIDDNPYLDADEYRDALSELDEVTRKQLEEGNWNVRHDHSLFRRSDFQIANFVPPGANLVRYWDFAATAVDPSKRVNKHKKDDPDYTVGLLLAEKDGYYYVVDVQRFRCNPLEVETRVRMQAEQDGYGVPIVIEQEPGSSGIHLIDYYRRTVLANYQVFGNKVTGRKFIRAERVSSEVEAHRVYLIRGALWIEDFLEELEAFPGLHDDQVDAFGGAYQTIGLTSSYRNVPIPASDVDAQSSWYDTFDGGYEKSFHRGLDKFGI